MPLIKRKGQAIIGRNIRELHKGSQYKQTKKEHGKEVADKQAIAIALETHREAGGK